MVRCSRHVGQETSVACSHCPFYFPTCFIPAAPGHCSQTQLSNTEAQLAQRTEQGAAFSRVDFEQLRIEHSQAGWAMQQG